jgi:hypothetical protein
MTKRHVETVMTFDKARKRWVEAMVAAYVKRHPAGHAKVVTHGNATWLKPDDGPPPSWTQNQVHKMHELAIEFECATELPPEEAVLRWGPCPDGVEIWFEAKTDEHRKSSYPPPKP